MENTKIDWCDSTWNPVTGCLHACEYCYARRIAERFGRKPLHPGVDTLEHPYVLNGRKQPYPFGFNPTFHRYKLNEYIGKQGRNIFVCSMADLFGDWVPEIWIEEIIATCEKAPQHNYLFLTKNYKRYGEHVVPKRENMWYGVSVTKESQVDSYDTFLSTAYTFASIEPILEDIKPYKHKGLFRIMDWIIVGVETGRRKDKGVPKRKWIEDIVNVCTETGTPIFMKSSLADIWGEPLIQEFPGQLQKGGRDEVCG